MNFPTPVNFRELPECDDEDLICRLENLYRLHARDLWMQLVQKFGHEERANDAVHEAFIRLYTTGLDSVSSPRGWLTRVATNYLIDLTRRDKRRGQSRDPLDWLCGDETPEDDAEAAEQRQLVHDALEQLRESDREILSMRYTHRLRSAQIARRLGVSEGAVDMRLSRARRRLEAVLEERGLGAGQLL